MKSKHTRSRRVSRRHGRKLHRRPPCTEAPASREFTSVDAAIMFTDTPVCGRVAVWLEPQTGEERACSTSF